MQTFFKVKWLQNLHVVPFFLIKELWLESRLWPLGKHRHTWENIIKTDLWEVTREEVNWNELAKIYEGDDKILNFIRDSWLTVRKKSNAQKAGRINYDECITNWHGEWRDFRRPERNFTDSCGKEFKT